MEVSLLSIFTIAFLASLGHCIGMCGGIVVAYSTTLKTGSNLPLWLLHCLSHLCYHSGKIFSYAILGGIAGGFGEFLALNTFVKNIAFFIIGVLLVFLGLGVAWLPRFKHFFDLNVGFMRIYRRIFARFLGKSSLRAIFVLGLCNGLLPCGVVYFFLLSSSVSGGIWNGVVVMIVFGFATMPSLLLLGMISSALQRWRIGFLKLSGIGMMVFGGYEVYKAISFLTN